MVVLDSLQPILETLPEGILVYSSSLILLGSNRAGRQYLDSLGGGPKDPWRLGDISLDALLHRVLAGDETLVSAEVGRVDGHLGHGIEARVSRAEIHGERVAVVTLREGDTPSPGKALLDAERHAFLARLLPGVAHDLRAPLTAISGVSQVAAMSCGIAPEVRSKLTMVQQQIERADALLRTVVSFARGPRRAERLPPSLNDAVRSTEVLFTHDFRSERLEVRTELERELPLAAGDPEELLQVVLYLAATLVEARRGSSTRAPLLLRTLAWPERVSRLEVESDSPSFDSDLLDHIRSNKGAAGNRLVTAAEHILSRLGGELRAEPTPSGGARLVALVPPWVESREPRGARQIDWVLVAEPDLEHALRCLARFVPTGAPVTIATSAEVTLRGLRASASGAGALLADLGLAEGLPTALLPRWVLLSFAPGEEDRGRDLSLRLGVDCAPRAEAADRLLQLAARPTLSRSPEAAFAAT